MRVLLLAGAMIAGMTGLVIHAPSLYTLFCDITGYGGTVTRAEAPSADDAARDATAADSGSVTVYFDANVHPGLDWEFYPEQRQVTTRFGETAKAWYVARNNTDETVVARALFNVTPYKAAPYFFKIECFCFTEEKLGPGEAARMPLVLYVDEQLLQDPDTREVRDITLSYTFARQADADTAEARDLKTGSEKLNAELEARETFEFDNDAPRR